MEVKSKNLDADWTYRLFGQFAYKILDRGLNSLNRVSESVLMKFVKSVAVSFQNTTANFALFVAVNFWLLIGYRDKRLEIKKRRLYTDILQGTLPIGIGAAVAISFILLIYIIT